MNINTEAIARYELTSPVQTEFVKNSDSTGDNIFTQVKRVGDICLYKRTGMDGRPRGFELFKIKTVKAGTPLPGGNKVENDYEQYPGASAFGRTAAFIGGENAETRADDLFEKWVKNPDSKGVDLKTNEVKPVKVKPTEAEKATRKAAKKAVTVAKNSTVYVIPAGEFTQADFALANGFEPRGKVYNVLQNELSKGTVVSIGLKKIGKGRPSAFFTAKV